MKRLIDDPAVEGRTPSEALLRALRDLDPAVEVVHVGGGRWWLGAVHPNEERRQLAQRLLKQLEQCSAEQRRVQGTAWIKAKLGLAGFALIGSYQCQGDPLTSPSVNGFGDTVNMVEHFAAIQAEMRRNNGEQAIRDIVTNKSKDQQRAEADKRMKDFLATDGRGHFAREMRDRKTFASSGMTGGRGKIILPYGA